MGTDSDIYTFSSDYTGPNAPAATLLTFADDFAAWLNNAARPWAAAFTVKAMQDGDGVALQLSASLAFTYTLNLAANAATGLASAATPADTHTGSAAPFTIWPSAGASRNWLAWDKSAGVTAAAGGFLPSIPATAPARPLFRFILNEAQAARLAGALEKTSSPRRASLYQPSATAWQLASVGPVQRPRRVGNLYRAGFKVIA